MVMGKKDLPVVFKTVKVNRANGNLLIQLSKQDGFEEGDMVRIEIVSSCFGGLDRKGRVVKKKEV